LDHGDLPGLGRADTMFAAATSGRDPLPPEARGRWRRSARFACTSGTALEVRIPTQSCRRASRWAAIRQSRPALVAERQRAGQVGCKGSRAV
jgi:hypothetical protein